MELLKQHVCVLSGRECQGCCICQDPLDRCPYREDEIQENIKELSTELSQVDTKDLIRDIETAIEKGGELDDHLHE